MKESVGNATTDIVTTWVNPGLHLFIIDYSFVSDEERTDVIMLYDYTLNSTIGYANEINVKNTHRDIIVKCADIPSSDGAHQIGVQVHVKNNSLTATVGAQLQVITLRSY